MTKLAIVCKQQDFGGERQENVCKVFLLLPEIEVLQEGILIITTYRKLNLTD